MIHNPQRDDDPGPGVTDGDNLRPSLPFARYQPIKLESSESPTRIEYVIGNEGIAPESTIQVRTGTLATSGGTVTYELETRILPPLILEQVNEILKKAADSAADPHRVARELYQATSQSGLPVWRTVGPSPLPISITDSSEILGPVIPSVGAYLRDPNSIGQRYRATRQIERQPVTVTTHLDTKKNVVHVRIGISTDVAAGIVGYVIPGTIQLSSGYASADTPADLRKVALTALGRFSEGGLKALREHMAAKAQEHFTSSPSAERQTFIYTKRFSCNSTVSAKIQPNRAVVAVSSGALDRDARRSGKATIYKWHISGDDSAQGVSAATALGKILPGLAMLNGVTPLAETITTLNSLARRQGVVARTSVENVLGSDVVNAIRSIPGLHITRAREETLLRASQIANSLRGINVVQVSTTPTPGIQGRPQVIRTMEVGVAYRADGKPFVQLVAWNQINNRMQVVLSADAVERHGGLKEVMLDLCQALHEQAKVDYPWQGRKRFLELLKELQRLDPGSSWVIQMGDAKFPQVHDIQSHRMIDQIAAPLIGLFGQLSHNGGVTDSYVNSPAEREIEIVLGESYQRYALALQIKDSTLRHVSVVPRIDIPSGELVLAWNQARKFRVQVADVKDRGQETLQKLVQHFASLVTSLPGRPAQQFRTSQLRKLLKRLSA